MIKAGIVAEDASGSSLNKIIRDEQNADATAVAKPAQQAPKLKKQKAWNETPGPPKQQWEEHTWQPPKPAQPQWDYKPHRQVTTTATTTRKQSQTTGAVRSFVASEWTSPPIVTSYKDFRSAMLNGDDMLGNIIEVTPSRTTRGQHGCVQKYPKKASSRLVSLGMKGPCQNRRSRQKWPKLTLQTKVTLRITAPECYPAIHSLRQQGGQSQQDNRCHSPMAAGPNPQPTHGGLLGQTIDKERAPTCGPSSAPRGARISAA